MVDRGLAFWSAALTGPASVDHHAYALFTTHPRFEDACRLLVAKTLARQREPVFARANKDVSRYFIGYFALYLDARGGLTLSSIRDLCTEMGLASPGRAAAILFRLLTIGYVRRDKEQKDRRFRRYVPTEEMRAAFRQSSRDELTALALIEPEATRAAERLDDPSFYKAFVLRAGEGIAAAVIADGTEGRNATTLFTTRNSGTLILLDIVSSAQPGDAYPPRGRVKMNVRELARKYEVSHSHVRKLLRDAEKEGLLTRNPDEQTGTITEKLRTGLIDLHVTPLIGNAVCAQAAIEATAWTPVRVSEAVEDMRPAV